MLTKVILLQSVPSLGSASSVVSVKLGYAKNFLIKKRLAIFANEENLKQVDKIKGDLSEKDARLKSVATSIQSSCKEISIDLRKSAIQSGRLYGSVSAKEIISSLKEVCSSIISLDDESSAFFAPRNLRLSTDIKYVGEYDASLALYGDVMINFSISIKSDKSDI
jgi:large subunit ribosomal protein L9